MTLRTSKAIDLNGGATATGTYYTETFRAEPTARRISVQAKRKSGTGTILATLQGGWPDSVEGTATDWVDAGLATAAINSAQLTQLATAGGEGYLFANFPVYRIKYVVGSAAATGAVHVSFY